MISSFDKKIKTRLKEKQNSTNAKQNKYNKNYIAHHNQTSDNQI